MKRSKGNTGCDVLVLSLATTAGLRHSDASLKKGIIESGVDCKVVEIEIGLSGKLRKGMLLTDLVEAQAARRTMTQALEAVKPRAVIVSTVTASLLLPSRFWQKYRTAIRFDSPASLNRPGIGNRLQHRLELRAFERADMLLPLGEIASETCGLKEKSVIVPVPIDVEVGDNEREDLFVAYAGNPKKRGLDILCMAWQKAALQNGRLVITGIDERDAARWLDSCEQNIPAGIEFTGLVGRESFLSLLRRARAFVNASRWEDFGIAQLEALSAGALLVTLPSPGANEALPLAKRLAPELVARDMEPDGLASSLKLAEQIDQSEMGRYRSKAQELLVPFRATAIQKVIDESLLSRLLDH